MNQEKMQQKQLNKTEVTEEKINLKDIKDLKIIDLSINSCYDNDYVFLEENLKDYLENLLTGQYKEELKNFNALTYEEFKSLGLELGYSLSNCQGDGVSLREGSFSGLTALKILNYDLRKFKFIKDNYNFNIGLNSYANHYQHNKTFFIDYEYIGDYEKQTEKTDSQAQEIEDHLIEVLRSICNLIELEGYKEIEADQEQQILRSGFNNFLESNNLEEGLNDLYDLDFTTAPLKAKREGYIKICDSGGTSINGLYIKPFEIKKTQFQVLYKEIEQEII